MKQNGIRRAALVLALIITLSGCQSRPRVQEIPETEPEVTAIESEPAVDTVLTESAPETEITPETEIISETALETEEAPETGSIEVMAEDTGIPIEEFYEPMGEGLNRITALPFSPRVVSNASDHLVFTAHSEAGDESARLALIDLEKRTVTESEYAFGDPDDLGGRGLGFYILNGIPTLLEISPWKLVTFSRELEVIDELELAEPDEPGEAVFLDSARVIFNRWDSESHPVVTVAEDGTMRLDRVEINTPGTRFDGNSVQGAINEQYWLVYLYSNEDYTQNSYAVYDEETGLLDLIGQNMNIDIACADRLAVYDYAQNTVELYSAEMPDAKLTFSIPENAYNCLSAGETQFLYFSRTEEDGVTILRHDPKTGSCTGEIRIPAAGKYRYAYSLSECGDSVYFLFTDGGEESLCEWTPTLPEQEESGPFNRLLVTKESQNTYLISEIYDRFGVSVYTGLDAVRYFPNYAVVPELDEREINNALTMIYEFLEGLPEGFVQEIAECYSSLDLLLTGRILPETGNRDSISDAAAFTNKDGGIEYAVFDITLGGLKQNIAHEFFHIIEDTMWEKNWQTEDYSVEVFPRWAMLNPEGFDYYWVYTDESGATYNNDETAGQYFTEGDDPDAIWFVDGYSMTYPKEDRARIFEYLATYPGDELPAYFAGKNMQLKAAYLSACIRDAFDCITDEVHPVWEPDTEYDLDYFIENYDLEAYYASMDAVG